MISKRSFRSLSISIILPLSLLVFPARIGTAAERAKTGAVDEAKQRAAASYVKLPLSFELNQGQSDPRVKFLSRGGGYTLFLTGNEAVLSLQKATGVALPFTAAGAGLKPGATTSVDKPTPDNGALTTNAVLRTRLVGANLKAAVTGAEELPGKSNYFIGNDPQKWRINVPNYAKVRYQGVYPGVDLVYYGNQGGRLEYDFVVAPGADPNQIKLSFVGADAVRVDAGSGDLVLRLGDDEVRFHKPTVYQKRSALETQKSTKADGGQLPNANRDYLNGRFFLLASNDQRKTQDAAYEVGLEIPAHDPARPLVIDPVLSYSSFLGGTLPDIGIRIAVDSEGNAYIAGTTMAANFPTTAGVVQGLWQSGGTCIPIVGGWKGGGSFSGPLHRQQSPGWATEPSLSGRLRDQGESRWVRACVFHISRGKRR